MQRIVALGVLALAARIAPAQDREERGEYKLTLFGKDAGSETYRIERFADGRTGIFAKLTLTAEVQGRKLDVSNDTALTLDKDGRPALYAGIAKINGQDHEVRLEIKDGKASVEMKTQGTESKREAKIGRGAFLLDSNVFAQVLPIARSYDAARGGAQAIRVFSPQTLGEIEGRIEDRGPAALRSGEKTVAVRHRLVTVGRFGLNVYALADGRVAVIENALQGVSAHLAEYAGWEVSVERPQLRRPEGVEETDVTFKSGSITLAASFTRPRGAAKAPAVVLISGSGPQDRDSNVVPAKAKGTATETLVWKGLDWNIFRSVAYALPGAGVAVLRYDDRGVGKSEGDFATAKLSDFVADARAAVAYLRTRDDVDPERIGLVGHSEGGIIAPMVAARDERIRAIFLMAGTAKPLDEIIGEQMALGLREQGVPEEEARRQVEQQMRLLAPIKSADGDWTTIDGQRTFVGWLREHFNHDPLREIRRVRAAVIVLQGMKDKQVFPENADRLEAAMNEERKANFEVKRFEELDHLFMKARAGIADYADASRRVDEGFLSFLAERAVRWLK